MGKKTQNINIEDRFSIRDYRKEDYPAIEQLWIETGLGDENRNDTIESVEKSLQLGGKLLVLIHKQTNLIVGTSWMTYDGRRIHLHHFSIKQEFQGKRLGKMLTTESLKFAREMRTQIKLEVHKENKSALRLYRSAGFESLGDYDIYIIRHPEDIDFP